MESYLSVVIHSSLVISFCLSSVLGFLPPFFPDDPFFPGPPPFGPGPGPRGGGGGGGGGAVAIVQTGPSQVVGAGPLISANNAFYDQIGIFPIVNVPTGGNVAQTFVPCFTQTLTNMNVLGCTGAQAGVGSVAACQAACAAVLGTACAGFSFNTGNGICAICSPAQIAGAQIAPDPGVNFFTRSTLAACAVAGAPNVVARSNIRARPANRNSLSTSSTSSTRSTPTTTTAPATTTTTTVSATTTTTRSTTTTPPSTTRSTSPATTTTGRNNIASGNAVGIPYTGRYQGTSRKQYQSERVITIPADQPSGELQLFVSSLMKLEYRSITMNSKIRGGVPLCSPCDQYTCISACIIISGTECEGVVYNLETQTCYGHKRGTNCRGIIYEQTSFYASKVTCDTYNKPSTTVLKYGRKKLYVHKHSENGLAGLGQLSPKSLDGTSLQESLLFAMVKHVASNFGYLVVPSNEVDTNIQLLEDINERINGKKRIGRKNRRMWYDRGNDEDGYFPRRKPKPSVDKMQYLWRMPSFPGIGTSRQWVEIEHYHGLNGSILAKDVTKHTCLFICKSKKNCNSLDYNVRTKSCWYHKTTPRCSALRRRKGIIHIRSLHCKRRSSDFL